MSFIVSRFNNFHITSPLQLSLQIQLRSYKTRLIVIALKKDGNRSIHKQKPRREGKKKKILKTSSKHHVRLSVCIDDLLPRKAMTIQQSLPCHRGMREGGGETAKKFVFPSSPFHSSPSLSLSRSLFLSLSFLYIYWTKKLIRKSNIQDEKI